MNILSIQSHVAYGHVGNAAATFPLQRIGVEVWPIHTVQFSNHTGYGEWTGRVFEAGLITELVQGIAERGVLGQCDGVLSGYMGSAETGAAILDAVARVKAANPKARYCCDPVIGDVGRGIYVRPGIPEFMREHAVPAADVVTPNQFELDYLSGRTTTTLRDALAAIDIVHGLGPKVDPGDLAAHRRHAGRRDRPRRVRRHRAASACARRSCRSPSTARAMPSRRCSSRIICAPARPPKALSRAASSVFGVLKRTADAGSREILLVEAQDEFVNPTTVFQPERL